MSLLSFLYRHGVWIAVPVFCLAAVSLVFLISSLVRLGEKKRICTLPLVAEQDVEFPEPGPVVLSGEGPLLTPRFSNLSFELFPGDGSVLTGSEPLMRSKSAGMSSVKLELRRFELPYTGRYVLRIRSLEEPRVEDSDHRILFSKPSRVETVSHIIGIVVSALLAIGSVVLFVLRLTIGVEG